VRKSVGAMASGRDSVLDVVSSGQFDLVLHRRSPPFEERECSADRLVDRLDRPGRAGQDVSALQHRDQRGRCRGGVEIRWQFAVRDTLADDLGIQRQPADQAAAQDGPFTQQAGEIRSAAIVPWANAPSADARRSSAFCRIAASAKSAFPAKWCYLLPCPALARCWIAFGLVPAYPRSRNRPRALAMSWPLVDMLAYIQVGTDIGMGAGLPLEAGCPDGPDRSGRAG